MPTADRYRSLRYLMVATFAGLSCFGPLASAFTDPPQTETQWNVLLITWDGVRRPEFSGYPDPSIAGADSLPTLPFFWDQLVSQGKLYGDPRGGPPMFVANATMRSLPAYHSIMGGSAGICLSNECGRIRETTFLERLRDELHLARTEVASIASWARMPLAVEKVPGSVLVNAGPEPLVDGSADAERDRVNDLQRSDLPPWMEARFDRYTHAQAMNYLRKHKPRFLHIGYNDADEWGHRFDYPHYLQALRDYDHYLAETLATLSEDEAYGRRTCILLTTDHGRGQGPLWGDHGNGELSAAKVFLFAGCPLAENSSPFMDSPRFTSHADIRPTIEHLFGLKPKTCFLCGRSLYQPKPSKPTYSMETP